MPKLSVAALALLASVVLISCRPVVSRAPLGTTVGAGADPRLLGTWIDAQSGDGSTFTNTLQSDGAIRTVMCDSPTAHGCNKTSYYRLHTVRLGAYRYIDAVETDATGKTLAGSEVPGHVPLAYRFRAKRVLAMYLMESGKARDAIRAGKIAGVVTRDKSKMEDVTLTASGAQLDAFLATPQAYAMFTGNKPILLKKK